MIAPTSVSKSCFLVNKYGTKRKHFDNKAATASTYQRYNKIKKVYTTNRRYLNVNIFKQHPWAIYNKGYFEQGQGLVKCGLCCLAKEKKCEMWYDGKKTSEETWLDDSDCWVNTNKEKRWNKH